MSRARGAGPDPARLQALAENLGQTPQAVARTLHEELRAARAQIDAGLASEDLTAVGDGAHAARNSALMVGAAPLLSELRALETAADSGELRSAREVRGRADADLADLIEALGELA
ncbi:MAG TPA: hypothetical protein VMF07_03230 [Solirubrobacteraceae bacterium]|nr:hypothetical protein [Solirubrobacteraceae bacterium]